MRSPPSSSLRKMPNILSSIHRYVCIIVIQDLALKDGMWSEKRIDFGGSADERNEARRDGIHGQPEVECRNDGLRPPSPDALPTP